jgi:hypothetical protein
MKNAICAFSDFWFEVRAEDQAKKWTTPTPPLQNSPAALQPFVEGEFPSQSIVIIELKRPQRKVYSGEDKDPCEQVYAYIEDILAGKVIGDDGQHIQVSDKTRFYCYVLADITAQLKRLAKRNEFYETPDGQLRRSKRRADVHIAVGLPTHPPGALPLYPPRQTKHPEDDRIHPTVGKVALEERGEFRVRPDQVTGSRTGAVTARRIVSDAFAGEVENLWVEATVFANARRASA